MSAVFSPSSEVTCSNVTDGIECCADVMGCHGWDDLDKIGLR